MLLWQFKHNLLGIIALLQYAKIIEKYWNSMMTTDEHAYGSPKGRGYFTDLGTDHTFMMTKKL